MDLDKKINNSDFLLFLAPIISKIYAKHIKEILGSRDDIDFESYGEEYELYFKKIFSKYNAIQGQLETLLKIPVFFDSIQSMQIFEKIGISEIDYYKYHYENFLIRIVTVLDLCGKLGSVVFNLSGKEKDASYYKFSISTRA